jgi:hypothetical protein
MDEPSDSYTPHARGDGAACTVPMCGFRNQARSGDGSSYSGSSYSMESSTCRRWPGPCTPHRRNDVAASMELVCGRDAGCKEAATMTKMRQMGRAVVVVVAMVIAAVNRHCGGEGGT